MPDLATDLGQVSDDKLSWTFHLKQGMKYEDGSPIKAQDFAYAIARSFATEELPGGPMYQLHVLQGRRHVQGPVQGQDALHRCRDSGRQHAGHQAGQAVRRPALLPDLPGDVTHPRGQGHQEQLRAAPGRERPVQVREVPAGQEPDPGEERPVGPGLRPGPAPVRRRVRLRLRPGPADRAEAAWSPTRARTRWRSRTTRSTPR